MKQCFPNVRGRGRPVHGRNSPRSPTSPLVTQQNAANRQQNNARPGGGAIRNQRQRNLNINGQVGHQMPASNRLNEMFAMLNQQKPVNEKIE